MILTHLQMQHVVWLDNLINLQQYILRYIWAPNQLLGQLGIYATWLFSIAHLQNQLRI